MLLAKDQNTLSAPNFLQIAGKRNSDSLHDHLARKPILKKNAIPKNNDEVENQIEKENLPQHYKLSRSQVEDSSSNISSEYMRRIERKKKSIFLQLNELSNSQKKKNRSDIKKISFQSVGNDESQSKDYHSNYKQSKVDIIFSNSNISDSLWDTAAREIEFDLPEHSYKNLKSSQVVEVLFPKQPSLTLNFKRSNRYQAKKSDRIIEDTDRKEPEKIYKVKTVDKAADKTLSTKAGPQSTAQSNFRQTTYYEQDSSSTQEGQCEWFTIKQTPPLQSQKQSQQLNFKKSLARSKSQMKLRPLDQSLLYQNRIQQARKRLMQSLQESTYQDEDDLLVTLNPSSSKVLPQDYSTAQVQLEDEFKEDFFEKINVYRFLNRLSYKIGKFLKFNVNKKALEELVAQMTRVKCFVLLNTEIELETLSSLIKNSRHERDVFLHISQTYIEKEKSQPYWRQVQTQFLKTSFLPFSMNDKVVKFLELTIPEIQKQLTTLKPDLVRNIRTKETLMLQLRFKLIKYLFYDLIKMNLFQNERLPISLKTTSILKKRLIQIIERNQWLQKIQFSSIPLQFQKLKQDFQYIC